MSTYNVVIPKDLNGHTVFNPFDMFIPSDEITSGDPQYFGFQSYDDSGYIFKYSQSAGTMRYHLCAPGRYAAEFADAASQVYDRFAVVFKAP